MIEKLNKSFIIVLGYKLKRRKKNMKNFIKDWVLPALIAIVIALTINTFIFQIVKVPTGSMISTIMPGDRLYVNKIFNVKNVKRGDILVFESKELDLYLVKRLIGLPGDKLEIKSDGKVFINGVELDEPYAIKSASNEQTFNVPEDCYFFMGDNRPLSKDARFWNEPFINKKYIKGEALFRVFPFNKIGKLK
jgi:signal peptidase I